jgi:exopolyphosphatase/pppGpp-phosphohydrolase
VLSGEEEGKLAAMGVLAAIPEAAGVVGDLGGGSIELIELGNGAVGRAATLPLGPLRLVDIADDDKKLKDVVDRLLATVPWLVAPPDPVFYAVGGAWRGLARIHMAEMQYPLHVIQNYTLSRNETEKFLDFIAKQSRKSLDGLAGLSKKRLEWVPLAARVLARIVKRMEPKRVVFSAWGLREGHLYSLLSPAERAVDPLLAACAEAVRPTSRFPEMGEAINAWLAPLFPKEDAKFKRLRHAAALLSDIAWNEHPDYRAEQAVRHALYMPVAGIDHPGRAFVATALHARYGGRGTVEEKAKRLSEMGSDHVIVGSDEDKIRDEALELTKGKGADILIDPFGPTLNNSLSMTRHGGRIVVFGGSIGPQATIEIRKFYWRSVNIVGVHSSNKSELISAMEFIKKHDIRPIISKSMKITDAPTVHKLFAESKPFGKITMKHEW